MSPEEIRSMLITLAMILSYIIFITVGMIIRKHFPIVDKYLEISVIPIGFSSFLFLYLFAITYEKRKETILSSEVLEAGRLYGTGISFNDIQEEMGLNNIAEVKRLITIFCREKA